MFYYFGYGSNLSVVSLRAKGVDPLSSEPAILSGWRLLFDIPDFFAIEGCTGNIQPERGADVHGVVHACRDADLPALDKLEALGVTYERVEASVVTYSGRRLRAFVYVGLPECLGPEGKPSGRYRNILVHGATDMRLQPDYVSWLRSIETVPVPDRGPFELPDVLPVLSLDELAERRSCVGLFGGVFDMADAPPRHAYLRRLLGGSDATLLFLKRMDTSDGSESFADIRGGHLDDAQLRYLREYQHEFAREYELVGRVDYGSPPSAPPPGSDWPMTERPAPPGPRSWRPAAPSDRFLRDAVGSPALRVLRRADATYLATGHENLGFLSEAYGFMPRDVPLQSLGSTHAAWDQAAAELTTAYRDLRVRERIEEIPLLPTDPEHLPDDELLRAAAILGMLAHAYWYSRVQPPEALPEAIERPWRDVRARLGRMGPPVLTYIDLIVYNWKLRDPDVVDPLCVENLDLLIPTVDNQEERTFYLTQTEILARCAPIVGATIGAQAAAERDDREAVEAELMTITGALQRVVRESLLKIDPNPAGATHVNPVTWAKTVAPFAVPFEEGVLGPSGTSSPIFNLLDVFFGRRRFDSFLGTEIQQLRNTYPPLWQELLVELSQRQLRDYIERVEDANLSGLWREALEAYCGTGGFLGRHRMKVYGYLELAFKVGRSVTIGGFQGLFEDRTWDRVDLELEESRGERVEVLPRACHHVRVKPARESSDAVEHVLLDVTGTGIHYEAGDRCAVLPEHSPELVQRTLDALGATGDEPVPLTPEWREAVGLRHGYAGREELSARDLLRFGQIRPVVPRVAEALHALSQDPLLAKRMHAQTTFVWELWDLVEHLARGGFDPSVLLRDGGLSRVVPPERFRTYSISSVMSRASMVEASEIALTVGQIRYRTEGLEGVAETERLGTASSFLRRAAGRSEPVSIVVEHPPRFGLPRDPATPIVLIAAGTGLSPFRGFLVERARLRDAGPAHLFLGLRERAELAPYEDELVASLATGRTAIQVAFSREDADVVWRDGTLEDRPSARRYVQDVLVQERTARELWALMHPAAGLDAAHVYVCGRSRFAASVLDALETIFRRFVDGTDEEREQTAKEILTTLIGQGRLKLEIFSGDAPPEEGRDTHDVSDIVLRNGGAKGSWLVIDGVVYDITDFLTQHPGGAHVLRGYAGMDGSLGYQRVHAGRTEVEAMLEIYAIGTVRRLELGNAPIPARSSDGPTTTTLVAMHAAVVRLTYLVVEMENALRNDQSIQETATTRVERPDSRSAYKLERAIETHERFRANYLEILCESHAPRLWARLCAVGPESSDPRWMERRLRRLMLGRGARLERGLTAAMAAELEACRTGRVETMVERVAARDARFLAELKSVLCDVLRVFERLEARTLTLGYDQLLAGARRIPEVVSRYFEGIMAAVGEEGWQVGLARPERDDDTLDEDAPVLTLAQTTLWEMQLDRARGFVRIRRTPVAVEDIADLLAQNEEVIRQMAPSHAELGVVVDMRSAPARNDPEFENAMRRFRAAVDRSYARVAVLIESPVGVLQVNRLSRDEGAKHFATRSEASAIKFAMGTG